MSMVPFKKVLGITLAAAVFVLPGSAFGAAAGPDAPPAETTLLPTAVHPATFLAALPFDVAAVKPATGPVPIPTGSPSAPVEPVLISPGKPSVAAEPLLISLSSPPVSGMPAAGPGPAIDLARLQKPFRDRFVHPRSEEVLFDANLVLLAAVNVADYLSTREALKYPGLHECNPLMKPFVGNDFAFAAVKAGTTVLNHLALKSLFKRNRAAAWILTTASNFVISYAVVNNMRLIREARVR